MGHVQLRGSSWAGLHSLHHRAGSANCHSRARTPITLAYTVRASGELDSAMAAPPLSTSESRAQHGRAPFNTHRPLENSSVPIR